MDAPGMAATSWARLSSGNWTASGNRAFLPALAASSFWASMASAVMVAVSARSATQTVQIMTRIKTGMGPRSMTGVFPLACFLFFGMFNTSESRWRSPALDMRRQDIHEENGE